MGEKSRGQEQIIYISIYMCVCINTCIIEVDGKARATYGVVVFYLQRQQTELRRSCTGRFVIGRFQGFLPHSSNIWFLGFLNLQQSAGHTKTFSLDDEDHTMTWTPVWPVSSRTSMSTTILAMKMNVRLNARNSSRVRGRQPFSVHLSTAATSN